MTNYSTKQKAFQMRDGILRDWNNGNAIADTKWDGLVLVTRLNGWFYTEMPYSERSWQYLCENTQNAKQYFGIN